MAESLLFMFVQRCVWTKTFWSATNFAPCVVPFPNISKILTNFGFSSPSFIFSKNSANLEEATPACIGLTAMQILVAPLLILQGEGVVQIQFFVPECFGEIHGTATGATKASAIAERMADCSKTSNWNVFHAFAFVLQIF